MGFWQTLGEKTIGGVINGILGLGFGSAQGAINNAMTGQLNEKTAELQNRYWNLQNDKLYAQSEQSADRAMQRTIDMYNLLQSPSAMVKQLKEAGLNPALLYGGGGMGGHVQSGPQAQAQNGQMPTALGLQNFVDPLTFAQIQNINADTENKRKDTDKKEEEINNIIQDTALKKSTELLNKQTKDNNEKRFNHELGILIANEAIAQNEQTMLETKNQMTNKQLEILENEAKLKAYEEELSKRFREKGWDLGSMTGLGSLFIQMGDKLMQLLNKWNIEIPEWMKF